MATNLQHEAIGVVSTTKGEVFAKGADGQMRRLAVGDTVFEGDVIVTANGSTAEIAPFNGPAIEIQEQQTVSIDSQVAPAAGDDATAAAVAPLGSTEATTVIQAVGAPQAGQDFNATLDEEAAAAGLAGGEGGGGHSFVDLLRIVETVPTVGYEFPINPAGAAPIITGELVVPTTPTTPEDVLSPASAAYAQIEGTEQSYTVIPGTSSLGSPASVVAGQYTGSLGTVVTVDANGNFVYTAPVTDETRPEVFTFNTVDGNGTTSTSTVTMNLVDTGVTSPSIGYEVTEGTTAAYTAPLGTSLDNPVTVQAGQYTGSLGTVVTVDADGKFSYTAPVTDESRPEVFTFNTHDGDGSPGTSTVTMNLVDTGVTSPSIGYEVTEGTTAAYTAPLGTSLDNPVTVQAGQYTGSLGTVVTIDADGNFSYKAPIGDERVHPNEVFIFNTHDADGSPGTSTVTFALGDAGPTAVNDGGTVMEDATPNAVGGNVLDNDTVGPDTPASLVSWDSVSAAAAHAALDPLGTLTLNSDGTWSFVLDNSLAAVQALKASDTLTENIGYTMQDADGTHSQATLTITVQGADDSASVVTASATGADATVYEHGLTSVADTSETTSGSFTVTATDGIKEIVIGGTTGGDKTVTLDQLNHLGTDPVSMDTGEGTLTLTAYNATTGVVSYDYALKAAISSDAPGSFDDGLTVTVNGIGGTHATDNLVISIMDDTPTFTRIDDAILGNSAGNLFGTHDISFGADGEQSINLSALTQISGLNYSDVHHDADGSAYVTAGAGTADSGVFKLTVNPDGTYEFDLLNARPAVEQTVTFPDVQGGQGLPSLTIGSGTESITFTGLGGDTIKPTSAGFGVNNGNLDSGDDFQVTFGNSMVDSITMGVKHQSGSAFTLNWSTDTGDSGQSSFTGDGNLTINPVHDFTSITVNVTGGSAKMDSFSYGEHILPADQTLQFNISATDSDGDVSAPQTLSVTLAGGIAGAAISGTSADESILGTASGETISGGGGNDTLAGAGGADTFVWHLADMGTAAAPAHDVVTDFNAAQGDVLNLSDVLPAGNSLNAVADSGHLVVQVISPAGMVQDIALQTVAANDSTANAVLQDMVAHHQILING